MLTTPLLLFSQWVRKLRGVVLLGLSLVLLLSQAAYLAQHWAAGPTPSFPLTLEEKGSPDADQRPEGASTHWSLTDITTSLYSLALLLLVLLLGWVVSSSNESARKEIALQKALEEANRKMAYLEHAAKILRHDMHSGIHTYLPRGISSLERRLRTFVGEQSSREGLRLTEYLGPPLRLLKEGLAHTQKVYAGVSEFTNLVSRRELPRERHDLRKILTDWLETTAYRSEVIIDALPEWEVNAPLFCLAIDNLIRNGLKYNDSPSKMVLITLLSPGGLERGSEGTVLGVIDNGRGMTGAQFREWSKPYSRKADQRESGTGLGLSICVAILGEHGFRVTAEQLSSGGTLIKIFLGESPPGPKEQK
jgi:signal transduction histidine kinase